MKKTMIKLAGMLNLLTAFVHLIPGQIDLASPLLRSNLSIQQKGELIAAWHIISILLFMTSVIILKEGFSKRDKQNSNLLRSIGIFYILISIPFMISSIVYSILAPQWIILLPIGLLIYFGISKSPNRLIAENI